MIDYSEGWKSGDWFKLGAAAAVIFLTLIGGMWLGQRKVNAQAYDKGYWDGVSYTESKWLATQTSR